ncbi:MAG: CPBP family intramembrane glutamic endopeptidase [Gemmatimonadota bacterium]
MSRRMGRALGLLVLILTAGIWFGLHRLEWPARALTTFLMGPLPVLMLLQTRLLDQLPSDGERESVYVSSAVSVWVLAALAMLAARYGGLTRLELRITGLPVGVLLGAAAVTTAAGLVVMAAGRMLRVPENALVDYLIPRTSSERIAFTGLSVSAGIGEELIFRSFLIGALLEATGSMVAAVAISVSAFAVSHAYQGFMGVIRVALLGLVLTAPFLMTGSVYPSIIAHTALDLLAGLVLADWLRAGPDAG